MPPPPPPSKSYLLVLDTDSEDEEEEETYYPRIQAPSSFPSNSQSRYSQPHIVEADEEDRISEPEMDATNDDSEKLSKTQKKNRNRRKKKKKKKKTDTCATDAQEEEEESKPRVSFAHDVRIRSYPRCFSAVAVPGDGGWPLGMENEPLEETDEVFEDYEAQKQERLKERWERILEKDCDAAVKEKMTKRPEGVPFTFETRQWDYTSGLKNPLFRITHEQERQAIFLDVDPKSLENSPPSPKRRTRSNSVNSVGSSTSRARSNSVSSSEQFNETYDQVMVHHCRNELEELRNLRTKSGATGCNCRKLNVYLPPKDGSGGKGAQRRRLKPSVLAKELKKRNMYNAKDSREKMEKLLHDLVDKEPCCSDEDCFCTRNGIDCQSDACSCWHDSHVHAKGGSAFPSVEEIKARCGNPNGMYTVNFNEIELYRTNILQCIPCSTVEG
ncbi:unnamed protein product [Cylindrotheca closterium]|uniref:Cysteine/serine-rich nuclear protein N-terminal domain-containing protein n=1 Tax=Cylindrotheca closterium TaxID=2856 RepID=A0AAD2JJR7_9STRA|nr:unnamed protein product [Cylindrotheca closterium]